MTKQVLSEDQVKQILDIQDFRHITKDKLVEFASLIPQMDSDVAIKCIEQFPQFKDYAGAIINRYYDLCENAIKDDSKAAISAYKQILDDLSEELKKPKITKKERTDIIQRMVEVGDKIAAQEDKKRILKLDVIKIGAQIGAAALDQVGNVDAEDARAVVDKGEGQVGLAGLVHHVGLHVQAGLLGHVDHRVARDLAQGLDAGTHLVEHAGHLCGVHRVTPPYRVCRDRSNNLVCVRDAWLRLSLSIKKPACKLRPCRNV